jgi:hypothetical protein
VVSFFAPDSTMLEPASSEAAERYAGSSTTEPVTLVVLLETDAGVMVVSWFSLTDWTELGVRDPT